MRSQFDNDGMRPDVTEVVSQVSDAFRRNMKRLGPIIAGLIIVGLVLTGLYKVDPGEVGVVRTFGAETDRKGPGLHYRVPFAQSVDTVNTAKIRRIEVGVSSEERATAEATMLTGDENIVEVEMTVQYRIADPSLYLFRLRDAEETLHATAEVAIRSLVGRTQIDDLMTTGRGRVQAETAEFLQKLMDEYESGLAITEVKLQAVDPPEPVRDAFHDVARAREEKEKLINQAKGYQEDKLPRAKGEKEKLIRAAEAYKEERVLRATGDGQKFDALYLEYKKADKVTRERLYLETIERLYSQMPKKIIIDEDVAKGSVPILPLAGIVGSGAGGR